MKLLPPDNYNLAISSLKNVTINNLFARSVVEQHVDGKVYVDNIANPRAFYVIHPYGMSLLYGDINEAFLSLDLKNYLMGHSALSKSGEWLQVFPPVLEPKIDQLLGNKLHVYNEHENTENSIIQRSGVTVLKHRRINFKFNSQRFKQFKSEIKLHKYNFSNVDEILYIKTNGSVVPNKFWNNASEFLSRGVGFSLVVNEQVVATAFSSFMHDNMLELGIETNVEFRKRGFASLVAARLIDYCMQNELEPVWACRRDNFASYHLAIRLGFEPIACLPFYFLD